MRTGRFVLLPVMFGFVLLCGTSLQAQWATSVIEQDWTITVFGGRFGYEQSVIFPGGVRAAKLYWGGGDIQIASGSGAKSMLPVIGCSLAVASLLLWRIRWKRRQQPDPSRL